MPAGNETSTLRLFSTRPWPLHEAHGVFTTLPSPLHSGHVCVNMTKPREVETWPLPAQTPHGLRLVPGLAPEPRHSCPCAGVGGGARAQPREVGTGRLPAQTPHGLRLVPGLAPEPPHSSHWQGVRSETSRL